jgi:hypothetical protein
VVGLLRRTQWCLVIMAFVDFVLLALASLASCFVSLELASYIVWLLY